MKIIYLSDTPRLNSIEAAIKIEIPLVYLRIIHPTQFNLSGGARSQFTQFGEELF